MKIILIYPFIDLKRLVSDNFPENWINDNIMDLYISLIRHNINGKVHIFPVSFWLALLEAEKGNKHFKQSLLEQARSFDLSQKDWLYVPINIDNKHWALILIGKIYVIGFFSVFYSLYFII